MDSYHVLILGDANSIHVQRWIKAIDSNKFKVTLITAQHMSKLTRESLSRYKVYNLPFNSKAGYFLNSAKLRSVVKEINPDVIHLHSCWSYGLLLWISGIRPDIVSVYGFEVFDKPGKSFVHKYLIRRILKRSDVVTSTSIFMAHKMNELGYPGDVKVIPFGVDTALFKPEPKSSKEIKIGTVKALEYKYGIDVLIKAFAILCRNNDLADLKLVIAGSGSKESELKKMVRDLDIGDKVTFRGYVPNEKIPEILNELTIFTVTSRLESESFGVAAIEAMACEKPVVVTEIGGLKEVVDHGKNGLTFRVDDEHDLADKILIYLKNPGLSSQYGAAGRKKVKREYEWSLCVQQMQQQYMDIIQNLNK